jgi:hypothetical protein
LRNITALIPQHLKNILTGLRIHAKTFREKQTLILLHSRTKRRSSVLEIVKNRFPFQGAVVNGSFSRFSFNENFDAKMESLMKS